jgi:hypothetical protein
LILSHSHFAGPYFLLVASDLALGLSSLSHSAFSNS